MKYKGFIFIFGIIFLMTFISASPTDLTSCGSLSSDTYYVLQNDINTTGSTCLSMLFKRNITIDLNGYTVNTGTSRGMDMSYSSNIKVYNGSIYGDASSGSDLNPIGIQLEGSKYRIENISIDAFTAIRSYESGNIIVKGVEINATYGYIFYSMKDVFFKESNFTWNGLPRRSIWNAQPAAFWDQSYHSTLYLEDTNLNENLPYEFYLEGAYTDVFDRSSYLNLSKMFYPDWVADTRFFEQHLIIINVTDQFDVTGSCSVQFLDNGILPRLEGEETITETLSNPTAKIYIPTGETGVGEAWITERLTLARSSSPPVITEYDFSNYTLTTRGWGEENFSQTTLDLTDANSTVYVDFEITTPEPETLPTCTVAQMLDLNNDGSVTTADLNILSKYIAGKDIAINGTKECEGINLFVN